MSKRQGYRIKRIGILLTMAMVFTMVLGPATPAMAGWLNLEVGASPNTIYAGEKSTLSADYSGISSEYQYRWYQGETYLGEGSSYDVYPSVTTTYRVDLYSWWGRWVDTHESETVTVTVKEPLPAFEVTATANPETVAPGGETTLTAESNRDSGVTYEWYAGSHHLGSGATFLGHPPRTGENTYRVVATWNGETDEAYVTVTVEESLPEFEVTATADPETVAPGGETTLTAVSNRDSGVTYEWYAGSYHLGSGATFLGHPPNIGENTYRVEATWNGETDDYEVTVMVSPPTLSISASATPSTIVRGEDTTLSANVEGAPSHGTVEYRWYVEGVYGYGSRLSTASSFDINPSDTTTYEVRARWSHDNYDTDWVSDTVTVTVEEPLPAFEVTASADPETVVPGGETTLTAVSNRDSGVTYEWYAGSYHLGSGATFLGHPPSIGANTYRVEATWNGETDDYEVTVMVSPPTLSIGASATPSTIVRGEDTTLSANVEGAPSHGTVEYKWYVMGNGNLLSSASSFDIDPSDTTTYVVHARWRSGEDDNDYKTDWVIDTVTVTVLDPLSVEASVDDDEIQLGGSVELSATAEHGSGGYTYHWEGDDGFTGDGATVTASPVQDTIYEVTVTDSGSQTATDTVSVTVTNPTMTATAKADPVQFIGGEGSSELSAELSGVPSYGTVQYYWYVWYSGSYWYFSDADKPIVSPSDTATYKVLANWKWTSPCGQDFSVWAWSDAVTVTVIPPNPMLEITDITVLNALDDGGTLYTDDYIQYEVTVENKGNVTVQGVQLKNSELGIDETIGAMDPTDVITLSLTNGGAGYEILSGWPFDGEFTAEGDYKGTLVSDTQSKTSYRLLELEAQVSDDLTSTLKWKAVNQNVGIDLVAQWLIDETSETDTMTVPGGGEIEFTSSYDGNPQTCILSLNGQEHDRCGGDYTEAVAWDFDKAADVEEGLVAQEHTYTISVTNTGNVPLQGLTIIDSLTGTVVEGLDLAVDENQDYTVAFTPYADDLDGEGNLTNTAYLYQEQPGQVTLESNPNTLIELDTSSVTIPVQMRYLLELMAEHGNVRVSYTDAHGEKQTASPRGMSVWLMPGTKIDVNTSSDTGFEFHCWYGNPLAGGAKHQTFSLSHDTDCRAVHTLIPEEPTPSPSAALTGGVRVRVTPSPSPSPSPSVSPSPSATPAPEVTPTPAPSTEEDENTETLDDENVPAGSANAKGKGFFSSWWSWLILLGGGILLLLILLFILSSRKKKKA